VERSPAEDRVAAELAARGLRATQQRVAVIRQLRKLRQHPTAAQIHRAVSRELPRISLKTVYEVLDSLVANGLASCVTEGGEPFQYESNADPHYHARCRLCGKLYDVPSSSDGHIRARAPLPEGFAIETISVTIVGRCPRCKDDF